MVDISDVILRLGLAALIGGAIGLNRDLHGKPTGVRTLGLVALGAATVTLAAVDAVGPADPSGLGRVMQGVLTGIGFLGAGVILHESGSRVTGMTTAACVWMTACIGMVSGTGNWKLLAAAVLFVAVLLIVGGPVERTLHRMWGKSDGKPQDM